VKIGRYGLCALMVVSLAACGGGGGGNSGGGGTGSGSGSGSGTASGSGTTATYTIGGTISGLSASGLVLADNGGDNLTVASGASAFTFSSPLQSGASYAVTVASQPSGENCTVASGTGMATANVASVAVTCMPLYTIGGSISGLAASGLVLADNGGDNLSVASGATSFTFATALQSGASYNVTVASQPTGQTCTVASGTGTATAKVTSVAVSCAAAAFNISGTITGLTAAGLQLQYYTGGQTLTVNAGAGTFAFTQPVPYGTTVAMNVVAQPYWQWCTPGAHDFSGPISANITTDTLSCATANAHVTTLAGITTFGNVNGTGSAARFNSPAGIAVDSSGNIYVADAGNNEIRKVTPAGVVTTLATGFSGPEGVAVDDSSGVVYVADTGHNQIAEISTSGTVTVLAGSGSAGAANGLGTAASFNGPAGVAVDSAGDVYVADTGNNEIRMITPTGMVSTLAGSTTSGHLDGTGTAASFNGPQALALDSSGNLFVADSFNNEIREVTTAGVVTTLAGSTTAGSSDGTGTAASFNLPSGIAVDSNGNIYLADSNNNEIRKVTSSGVVTTLAAATTAGSADGTGASASFKLPWGIGVVDASGVLYVGDYGNDEIRQITPGS
jgi:sugar lactone lactonase YvrE